MLYEGNIEHIAMLLLFKRQREVQSFVDGVVVMKPKGRGGKA